MMILNVKIVSDRWCKPCQINNIKKNFATYSSGNEKIDEFIQEIRLNIENYNDIIFEWIPYNQFNDIKKVKKSDSATLYSAIWIDGSLKYVLNKEEYKYERIPDEKVFFKCLNNSQNIIFNELKNEIKSYSINVREYNDIPKIYGISQNSDTKDYILVFSKCFCEKCGDQYTDLWYRWCKPCQKNELKQNFANWSSGNKKIDEFIQEMQLNIESHYDIIVKWIPYNQFNDIKEVRKSDSATLSSAIWIDGPLRYDVDIYKYERIPDEKVVLKCLNNSQNIISNELTNEIKSYSINIYDVNNIPKIYGISQNLNTKDYIIVLGDLCKNCCDQYTELWYSRWCKPCQINYLKENFANWNSENEKIDEFIQEIYKYGKFEYEKKPNEEVTLKYLNNSQNIVSEFLNEVKMMFFIKIDEDYIPKIYGISQNSDTKDYILVLSKCFCEKCGNQYTDLKKKWCKPCQKNELEQNFANWSSGNEKIDKFI
ncbi:hypothetical protein RclHR1_15590002 [Rhizophagus clarus]|uniref:Uncharacterized protein n=1 Tax=Rhizophagus clarus TaxID=94130 RepID=A0A2Z6QW45_9GLOM|nr:hypothetical protein RclHR1_15590002 [Rhizophagus clarus]